MSNHLNFNKIFIIPLFLFLIIPFVFSFDISPFKNKIVDSSIQEKFLENHTQVRVFFNLNDPSKIDFILGTFSDKELSLIRNSSNLVVAEINSEGLNKLIKNTNVGSIYYDSIGTVALDTSVSLIDVKPYVWNLGYTGDGIKVCIIDSGIDTDHASLSSNIVDEYCYCGDNCCPDSTYEDTSAEDDYGHGTHVAGIVASQDSTYKGVAYDADLYIVKITNSIGDFYFSDLASAITKCEDWGVDIITMSLQDRLNHPGGSSCPTSVDTQVDSAYNSGIFLVAASGNQGYFTGIGYPACSPNVVSVGAVTDSDKFANYSNRDGDLLDILAPGGNVQGDGSCIGRICSTQITGGFTGMTGTSQAAPHIAGVAALLLERDSTLTPSEIKSTLTGETEVFIWDFKSQSDYPRVNASSAIDSLCSCTDWAVSGSCGSGGCNSFKVPISRTCDPSGCDLESDCDYDISCIPGGSSDEYTVCASGCDYTTINSALSATDENDRIVVTDSRTYSESLVMTSNTGSWLECTSGAKLYGSGNGIGINITERGGFYIKGCIFDYFDYAIYLNNASHGDLVDLYINRSDVEGIALVDDTYDVRMENLDIIGTLGDHAIHFDGYDWSASIVSNNKLLDSNIEDTNSANLVWVNWGLNNEFKRNNFSGAPTWYYGLELNTHNNNAFSTIEDNNIFSNYIGLYLHNSDYNQVSNNIMCPSNSNKDFEISGYSNDNTGDNNQCDNPENWNDNGTSGCSYICDLNPEVTLIFPRDGNFIEDVDEMSLICLVEDEIQVNNVSLYTNVTGSWILNQTKSITGISNATVFEFPAENGFYMWNCMAFDNGSHSDLGNLNWTFTMNVSESSSGSGGNYIYYKFLNISENSGKDLTNYPIQVDNFDCESHCDSTGKDIKVLYNNLTELSFGLEKINDSFYDLVFRINLPSNGFNDSISIQYGDPEATHSNSSWNDILYDVYDDFSTNTLNVNWICVDNTCNYDSGSERMEINAGGGAQSAILTYNVSSFDDVLVELDGIQIYNYYQNAWLGIESSTSGTTSLGLLTRSSAKTYKGELWMYNGSYTSPSIKVNGDWTSINPLNATFSNLSSLSTRLTVAGFNDSVELNSTIISDNMYIRLHARDANVEVDNFRVRTYTFPEPSYFISQEYINYSNESSSSGEWWDTDWQKRKELNITENSGIAQINYSVLLNVSYDSDMQNDFDDLRFVINNTDELEYYLEEKNDGVYAYVWVLVPELSASSVEAINMYYGKSEASSNSNREETFLLFDDFSSNPFSNGWNCWDATCTYQSGTQDVDLIAGSGFASAVMSYDLSSYSNIEIKYTESGLSSNYWFATEIRTASGSGGTIATRLFGQYSPDAIQIQGDSEYSIGGDFTNPTNFTGAWYNFSSTLTTQNLTSEDQTRLFNTTAGMDNSYVNLHGRTSSTITIDDVRIRKYTLPEPSYSFGSEESQ